MPANPAKPTFLPDADGIGVSFVQAEATEEGQLKAADAGVGWFRGLGLYGFMRDVIRRRI